MHLDEEQLQRVMHGEFPAGAGRLLREHAASCPECRERLLEANRDEEEVHSLLAMVDHPVPMVRAESAIAWAAREDGRASGRWAAGIVLALTAAGAAYAAPGSPLPGWTRAAIEWVGAGSERQPAVTPEAPPAPEIAGLAIAPGADLTILFERVQPEARVRVTIDDGTDVRVRAPAGAAAFTLDSERLLIDNAGPSATYDIEIPRGAAKVEIRVVGARIFLKEGDRITAAARDEASGAYLLPLEPTTDY